MCFVLVQFQRTIFLTKTFRIMKKLMCFSHLPSKRRFTVFLSFLLVAVSALYFSACRKDALLSTEIVQLPTQARPEPTIKIEDAKKWFNEQKTIQASSIIEDTVIFKNANPTWETAFNDFNVNNREFVVAPLGLSGANGQTGTRLLISRNQNGSFEGVLMLYVADKDYHARKNGQYDVKDFTGFIVYTDMGGKYLSGYSVENGVLKGTTKAKVRQAQDLGVRDCEVEAQLCEDIVFRPACITVVLTFAGCPTPTNNNSPWGSYSGPTGGGGGSSVWANDQPVNLFTSNQMDLFELKYRNNGLEEIWDYLKNNHELLQATNSFLDNRGWNSANKSALMNLVPAIIDAESIQHIALLASDNAYYNSNQQAGFPALGSEQWENNVVKPFLTPELMIQYSVWCVILKHQNPTWPDWKIRATAFWNTTKELLHTGLDICGMIPGAGEPFDFANGVFYTIEGDGLNATLSYASTVPVVGWVSTSTKYAMKVVKTAKGVQKSLPYVVDATTRIVSFGKRSDLREVLNITDALKEAHHIIPWAKSENKLVQKAVDASKPFHMNHAGNGIEATKYRVAADAGQHANHPAYDALVERDLNAQWNQLTTIFGGEANIPADAARNALINVQNTIKAIIEANPNTKINDLVW